MWNQKGGLADLHVGELGSQSRVPRSAVDFPCDLDTLPYSKLIKFTRYITATREDHSVTATGNDIQPSGGIRRSFLDRVKCRKAESVAPDNLVQLINVLLKTSTERAQQTRW